MTDMSPLKWMVARPGEQFRIPVAAADTGGSYSIVEIVSVPGDATPLHRHTNEDEFVVVLEGTMRVALGDKICELTVGESAMLPRGIPHAWGNRTESDIRTVWIVAPGGCEEGLRMVAESKGADVEKIGERFQVEVLGPAPF